MSGESGARAGRPIRVYVPVGMLGYGFPAASLEAAVARRPDVIAVDAGSTDPGPYYLGSGASFTSRPMVKRDLGLIVAAAAELRIPLIVGSAGGAGARPHLEWALGILREIVRERGIRRRVAVIDASLDRAYLKRKLAAGDVVDFEVGSDLTEADVDACEHIVAQMGIEPFTAALDAGADIVLAGRAFDAAVTAVVPARRGVDLGIAYHMGKIAECGSIVALPRESDGIICDVHEDHFTVEPADPGKRCPVEMVAAHTLYEKPDPGRLEMPGGTLLVEDARFEALDERSVRVSGSRFAPSDAYFVKIEGAARAGFRAVCVAGIRDPRLIVELDDVLARVREKVVGNVAEAGIDEPYEVLFRIYGRDGVMGALEPVRDSGAHELGLVIDVIAAAQETANAVCALARSATLHMGYEGRIATGGNLAFPFSPAEFPAPPSYEFRAYHLMRLADPLEPFETTIEEL